MPTKPSIDELRARFEASRSFEDDDDWLPSKSSANSSRRSTLTSIKKRQPSKNLLTVKKVAAAAIKRKSVDLEASKKKWQPTANWEPPSYQEKAFVPEKVESYGAEQLESYSGGEQQDSSYGGAELLDPHAMWMEGWRFDVYGRPVKMDVVEEVGSPLDILRKGIAARSEKSPR